MRLLACFLILLLSVPASAQTVETTQAGGQTGPLPTLRTGVRLVVVDIVVTDKNHHPVHGLTAGDFQVYENRTSQTFKSFEEHVALSGAASSRVPPMPKLPAGVFTNFVPGPTNGPLNVILLDRLNTPLENQNQMQQQIVQYVNSMKPGSRVAVFGLTDHLTYLQSFTADPAVLKAVLSGKAKGKISALLADPMGTSGSQPTASDMTQKAVDAIVGDNVDTAATSEALPGLQESVDLMRQFETESASFQDQLRARYTLDAMNLLARYLAAFPGRKNLIWFSGSFPVNILPDLDMAAQVASASGPSDLLTHNPFAGVASLEKEFRQTSALLSRSQVSVYPIQAKGLDTQSTFQASSSDETGRYARPGGRALMSDVTNYQEQKFSENSTMFMLAQDTGGKATVNTNDLATAVEDSIETGSNYYTIAYSPTNPDLDGTFRTIEVKLRDPDYSVSYRRGYFAEDTERAGGQKQGTAPAPATAPTNAMKLALTHGGPNPMQLIFSVRVQPVSDKLEAKLAPEDKPGSKAGKGPYRFYRVAYAIDPKELHFDTTPDGVRHALLEFISYVYDANGNLVDSVVNAVNASVPPAAYAQLQRTGVPFHQQVSVPEKGDYYLRIAMHDVQPDQVGAIEIPVNSVRGLPPMEASAKK